MTKKIFAVLAIVAALAWAADIAITFSQGGIRPTVAVKVLLIGCFLFYAFKVFVSKQVKAPAPNQTDTTKGD